MSTPTPTTADLSGECGDALGSCDLRQRPCQFRVARAVTAARSGKEEH